MAKEQKGRKVEERKVGKPKCKVSYRRGAVVNAENAAADTLPIPFMGFRCKKSF